MGCTAGLASVLITFISGGAKFQLAWPLPGGVIAIQMDALSAFFLFPVFIVMGVGSIYGEGYWPEMENQNNGRKLSFFYGALTAGLLLVMIGGDVWSFLIGWEIVGLSAYFLVTTESTDRDALRAGWIYLIATHIATLVLFGMFNAIHAVTGTWLLDVVLTGGSAMIVPVLLLAFVGFGIKAGLMPFHVWLPEAHASAPSHISAILSGIVLKVGVYGLIRVMTLVPMEPWFGGTLLFAGILSGILGVVFALAQHDLKRLLAYHSIENIGIIFIGLGIGVLGQNSLSGNSRVCGRSFACLESRFF